MIRCCVLFVFVIIVTNNAREFKTVHFSVRLSDRDTKKHHSFKNTHTHTLQNRKKKRESFVEERTDTLPFLVGRLNSTARIYTVSLSLFHSRVVVVVVVVC